MSNQQMNKDAAEEDKILKQIKREPLRVMGDAMGVGEGRLSSPHSISGVYVVCAAA